MKVDDSITAVIPHSTFPTAYTCKELNSTRLSQQCSL